MVLRWIREATNNLLPFAQIGGEMVGAQLLSLFRIGMAAATTGIDLTFEMLWRVAFTVFGIAVLMSFDPLSTPLWHATIRVCGRASRHVWTFHCETALNTEWNTASGNTPRDRAETSSQTRNV